MTAADSATRSVVVERELTHPPDRIWRALTLPHLIGEWLMTTTFEAEPGRRFTMSADWGRVDCQVQEIEPNRSLSYSWDTKDLRSVVTWTLTPTARGTRLRMEQAGFRTDQEPYFRGASVGWPRYLDAMERMLDGPAQDPGRSGPSDTEKQA